MATEAYTIKRYEFGNRLYTTDEQKSLDHTEVTKDFMIEQFNILIDSMIFGKKSSAQCKMNLIQNLKFYLSIMHEERIQNKAIGIIYDDTYYKKLYCIDSIAKRLLCRGISGPIVKQIASLYFDEGISGIGIMEIENTPPFKSF